MDILSAGRINITTPAHTMSSHFNSPERKIESNQSGINVSISPEAQQKLDEEANPKEKDDFGKPLRLANSKVNASKEDQSLSLEEKIEQRIEEVKEEIKEVQQEIQALKADGSTKAEEKIKILTQKVQTLFAELNGLMEQKLEQMK